MLTFPSRNTAENVASGAGLACLVLSVTPADTITGGDLSFNLTTRDGSKGMRFSVPEKVIILYHCQQPLLEWITPRYQKEWSSLLVLGTVQLLALIFPLSMMT